jgi:hypothetical protein
MKLSKLRMPEDKKSSDLDLSELDMGSDQPDEGSPEEEAAESPDQEDQEAKKGSDQLAHVDDEELIAEIKKRGLMDKLKQEDQPADHSGEDAKYL